MILYHAQVQISSYLYRLLCTISWILLSLKVKNLNMYRRVEESEVLMFWRYLLPPSSRQKGLFCYQNTWCHMLEDSNLKSEEKIWQFNSGAFCIYPYCGYTYTLLFHECSKWGTLDENGPLIILISYWLYTNNMQGKLEWKLLNTQQQIICFIFILRNILVNSAGVIMLQASVYLNFIDIT
jgi:hypothetical protein